MNPTESQNTVSSPITPEVASVSTPATAPTNVMPVMATPSQAQAITPPAKSNRSLWCIVIAIVLALLTVCCVCSIPFFGLGALAPILSSTSTNQDFNKDEYTQIKPEEGLVATNLLEEKYDLLIKQNPTTPFVLKITEKEILQQLISNTDSKGIAEGIYLNFDNNRMSLRVELSKVLEAIPEDQQDYQINPEDVKDIFLNIEAKVASNGKTIEVTKLSTGSPLFDLFLGGEVNQSASDGINKAFEDFTKDSTHEVQKIEIKEGELNVTMAPRK